MSSSVSKVWQEFRRLSQGELPLSRALFGYVVIYGLTINVLTNCLALLAYMVTSSVTLTLVLHFAALPYNIVACSGAWKSIDRYNGPRGLAAVARLSVIGLFVLLLIL
jgi:hypothetical protein